MKTNTAITLAFGICFTVALFAAAKSQQIGGGGSGGGGTPGGSTTQIQYNNAGAFGGNAGLTYNGTTTVTITSASDTLPIGGSNLTIGPTLNALGRSWFLSGNEGGGTGGSMRMGSLFFYTWQSTNRQDSGTTDTGFAKNAAGVMEINNGTVGTFREAKLRSVVVGGTVPGISGCTAGTQTGGATAGTYSSGTTGACTVVLTLSFTAPTGWSCWASDRTTPANLISQSASTTTTATLTGTTVSGDVISYGCLAY